MSSGLEARLQYLESREDSLTREMVRLKTENAQANNKVWELNAAICQMKQEADSKSKKIEEDLNSILEYRQSIEDRLSRLESQVLVTRELDDRLSSLETIINNLREDVARCQRFASDQVETMVMGSLQKLQLDSKTSHHHTERRLDQLETDCARNRQSVSDKIGNLETRVMKRLEDVEAVMKTKSRKVDKLVAELETRRPEESLSAQACAPPPTSNRPTPSIPPAPPAKNKGGKNLTPEEWKRLKERSHFNVGMSDPRTIQVRTRQRVEGYGVVIDSDCVDTRTGVFTTPVFGPYIFGVSRLISLKDGGVRYYLCGGDGRREEVFVSRESGKRWQVDYVDWDCPEGFKVWVEVEAGRGGARLTYRVVFNGRLNK